ncbi:MAG: PhoH family protein [Verrucomicrobiota bacterium]
MRSQVLEFESPHFLQSLFADDLRLLKEVERELAVRVTTRDGWIKLEGEDEEVASAEALIRDLEAARRKGAEISVHAFRFAVEMATAGEDTSVLSELVERKMLGSATKPPVMPKTRGQLYYMRTMDENDIVFGVGPAGTGKTYLAMARALQAMRDGEVARLVLTRPAVEAGEALGFLPGDMQEKIFPYLRPLYDALYDMLEPKDVEKFMDSGMIEIAPLAFMRGRTLNRAFVILDEAQNTTREQMFMFLTRLGLGSRAVITGDPSQIDLRDRTGSGLTEALVALPGVRGVGVTKFDRRDVVRHRVVQGIIDAYDRHRGGVEGDPESTDKRAKAR